MLIQTNYIDRLDSALLRPGRIDRKVQYQLATKAQAAALFLRFYPESYTTLLSEKIPDTTYGPLVSEKAPIDDEVPPPTKLTPAEKEKALAVLSQQFASNVPEHEFSTAELQGFLLSCKQQPEKAVAGIAAWVETENSEREEKKLREEERRAKIREKKELREAKQLQGSLMRLGNMGGIPRAGGVGGPTVNGAGSPEVPVTPLSGPPGVSAGSLSPTQSFPEAGTTGPVVVNGTKQILNGIAKLPATEPTIEGPAGLIPATE